MNDFRFLVSIKMLRYNFFDYLIRNKFYCLFFEIIKKVYNLIN